MIVRFERSGGFAGLRKIGTVDSDNLSPEEQQKLRALVEAADFFSLPKEIRSKERTDRFQYKVYIETKEKNHEVRIDEAAAPAPVLPLLEWLNAHSSV